VKWDLIYLTINPLSPLHINSISGPYQVRVGFCPILIIISIHNCLPAPEDTEIDTYPVSGLIYTSGNPAISLLEQGGIDRTDIAEVFDVSRTALYNNLAA
jgi:hypothetical protein